MPSTAGSGRGKRQRHQTSNPTVSAAPESDAAVPAKRRRITSDALRDSNGDYDGAANNSGEDDQGVQIEVAPSRPAVKYAKFGLKPPKIQQSPQKNVYDVPSSGDEIEVSGDASSQKQSRGKSSRRAGRNANSGALSSSRDATTRNKGFEGSILEEDQERTPSKARTQKRVAPDTTQSRSPTKTAVKGAKLSRSKSLLGDSPSKLPPQSPKGILTPRHKRPGRPRKSVVFDSEDNKSAGEVFFEDLPSKGRVSKPRPNSSKTVAASQKNSRRVSREADEEEDDDDDDEVCVICSKPDSEPPNEIIFCESCEKAFHQECYGIPVIPDDDWFCKDCLQEDAIPGNQSLVKSQEVVDSSDRPDIPNFEQHLRATQRILLDRCSGARRIRLRGHEESYEKVFQLVEQSVLAGEGNSMLIIGARGCGKTMLVETVVSDLAANNKESFHVVRLNGFIHTDDKLALKEIWRQLGKEMEVEDDLVNKTNNYADTLASLLALLSHPSEITGIEEGVTSKSVVFVIDEFDLFATHARQTLLYNLFDIAQARKAPIAVLGVTTRIDVVESLEKRVKSRFSHRYVHLSLPKSIPAYWDICKQGLLIDEEDIETEGIDAALEGFQEFQDYWHRKIEALHKTASFQDHLEYHFYTAKSIPAFLTTCVLPLSVLSASNINLRIPTSSSGIVSLEAPDSKTHLLSALSDLDLALLISAARLEFVAHTDTINFAMAYDEYSSQMGKQRVQSTHSGILALGAGGRVWGRAVAGMAWERLVSLGLLMPAGIGGRSNALHGGLESRMWRLEVALDEIPASVELPGFLVKWCNQI
ncbi:origin recognition complex subunit 4 C-terminus-domain-containing protein [Xylariales sp. PMI_506]|nr:origin recognition complex subunit 4 C-terminus-domain-containing protein [Xylariales sp. PMI_506]